MNNISTQKNALRKEIRKKMRAICPEIRNRIDAAICQNIFLLPQYQSANTIFCFIGIDWEVNTTPLITSALEQKKRVAIPLCTGPGIMEAHIIQGFDDLTSGAYNIPAPSPLTPICIPEEIDFAIIPCVSCDRSCMRLGQGGGFYDRFMGHASFFTAALCREAALLDQVPAEPWDRPVNCVVTEAHTFFLH